MKKWGSVQIKYSFFKEEVQELLFYNLEYEF